MKWSHSLIGIRNMEIHSVSCNAQYILQYGAMWTVHITVWCTVHIAVQVNVHSIHCSVVHSTHCTALQCVLSTLQCGSMWTVRFSWGSGVAQMASHVDVTSLWRWNTPTPSVLCIHVSECMKSISLNTVKLSCSYCVTKHTIPMIHKCLLYIF